jgi:hypothetical protein
MKADPVRRRPPPVARLAAALLCATQLTAFPATAHRAPAPLVAVDVVDRSAGQALDVHARDNERYVVGTPGHEYSIRIRNTSGERVLAVTSVDGVNVVSGETASPDQAGYVIEAGGSVEIAGWRRSLQRTSAFYFTDLGDSYAARTGRPDDVGVIGVAVFREDASAISQRLLRDKIAAHDAAKRERSDVPAAAAAPSADNSRQESRAAGGAAERDSKTLASRLGTGFGRDEASFAQRDSLERATATPADTLAIRYDRRENLIAMGILPSPRYAQRAPDPFPALRFVPAPR